MQNLQERINVAVKAKADELSEKEGRGFIEAAWLQSQTIIMSATIQEFADKASKLGYVADDFEILPYISTHGPWYSWFSYEIKHPILGNKTQAERFVFASRGSLRKDFVEPLYQKEMQAQAKKENHQLRLTTNALRLTVSELHAQIKEFQQRISESEEATRPN